MCVLSSNMILIQGLTTYELLPTAMRQALKIRQIAEDCHIMDSSTRYETPDSLFWIYIFSAPFCSSAPRFPQYGSCVSLFLVHYINSFRGTLETRNEGWALC